MKLFSGPRAYKTAISLIAVATGLLWEGFSHAYTVPTGPDWAVNFDNTLQYTLGWRAQKLNDRIGNDPAFHQGDYKFKDRGDLVTSRIQDLIELQAVYKKNFGLRLSGSVWKDFAYDDDAETNPKLRGVVPNVYRDGEYSSFTKRYFMQGGELLDAFVFANGQIGGRPTYLKAGRLSQFWGNAFFFGFSNIAYSQHPVDFIKGFSQPGSEIKELFLPRTQVLLTTELTPELAVTAQYFFEFRPGRFPEGGTYLGFVDFLFEGPPGTGVFSLAGIDKNDGFKEPDDINNNFGIKVAWSPKWAGGDMSFYYRQFDDIMPWLAMINPQTFHLQDTFAERTKLVGFGYERTFGAANVGLELNTRFDTALSTRAGSVTNRGATGTISNVIANTFVQLPTNPLWKSAILLAEASYTHLHGVTGNADLFNDDGGWQNGAATKDAVAAAILFTPQWSQVFPGIDLEMPLSWTRGIYGNPAYAAGSFYAQGSDLYSVGLKAIYHSKHSVLLQYNGYHYRAGDPTTNAFGLPAYKGGNGAFSLNDRGWVELQFKTSF